MILDLSFRSFSPIVSNNNLELFFVSILRLADNYFYLIMFVDLSYFCLILSEYDISSLISSWLYYVQNFVRSNFILRFVVRLNS